VIKGSYPSQRFDPIFGNELTGSRREEMIERLRARPQAYVAQELVNFSQAPAWSTTHVRRLLPRGVGLRVFVAATPNGHVVMPGRADPRLRGVQCAGHLDAARRFEQGHLDPDRCGR
jgi:uncharacterized circularly permuted ATP-grasp superfamily protein